MQPGRETLSAQREPALRAIRKGFYRVTVGDLTPLPLESTPLSDGVLTQVQEQKIRSEVLRILKRNGIEKPAPFDDLTEDTFQSASFYENWDEEEEDDHIMIVGRHPPGCDASGKPTIFIEADWDEQTSLQNWPSAILELHTSLNSFEEPIRSFDIELTATFLTRKCFTFPILDDPQLLDLWNSKLGQGLYENVLQKHPATKDKVTGLSLFRYGYRYDHDKSPVTLFIPLDYESNEEGWTDVKELLRHYIKEVQNVPRTIHIWLEHSSDSHSAYFPLVQPDKPVEKVEQDKLEDIRPYQPKPALGADLSASRYVFDAQGRPFSPPFGTIGCYLRVKYQSDYLILALTNYHVVRPIFQGFCVETDGNGGWRPNRTPRHGTALREIDQNGLDVQMSDSFAVEHPSRHRHNKIMFRRQSFIDDEKSGPRTDTNLIAKWEDEMKKKKAFFDAGHHRFGYVWAASGFAKKTMSEKRLDWALIRVLPDRVGENSLPDETSWIMAGLFSSMPGNSGGHLQQWQPGATITSMQTNTKVWKMGATSGPSVGRVQGFRDFIGMPEAKYMDSILTQECTFSGAASSATTSLGAPGDSGAIVYDNNRVPVGLLFRESTPQRSNGHQAYVTPLEDVFTDIKERTGIEEITIL